MRKNANGTNGMTIKNGSIKTGANATGAKKVDVNVPSVKKISMRENIANLNAYVKK